VKVREKTWQRFVGPLSIVIIVAVLVVVVGLLLNNNKPATQANYTVQRGTISAVVRTTGKIEPVRQTKLTFQTSSNLRQIYIKPGDFVPAGTLLMQMDTTQLEKQVMLAQAQRDVARFNLNTQAQRTPNQSASELYAAARQSELADTQLANARANLEAARLYAPFDGIILSVDASEGDNVGSGQAVATLADLNHFQVRADVDEIDVANVAVGQAVQFTLDAFPGKSFTGKVTLVASAPSQRQGSTTYTTLVSFERPADLYLRPGMAANLTITSLSRSNVLLVPNRALENIGLGKYVTRVRADGSLEKAPVETGLSNADQTEIISGLNEGDRLSIPR
jgi:HlyD family secretion protein